jgi:hypothetical protein
MSRRTGFVLALALLATPLCSATLNAQSGVPDLEQEIRQRGAATFMRIRSWVNRKTVRQPLSRNI